MKTPRPISGHTANPWEELRRLTPARIALGRAGISLPALMRLMGHAHVHTTLLYIQLTPRDVFEQYTRAVEQITGANRLPLL